jgi:pimeloyl-ACP methyl ester carboxylesterase
MRTTRNGLHVMNALMPPSETGRGAAAVRGRQLASRLPAAAARFLRPAAVVAAAGLLVTAVAPLTASASASRPSAAWRLGGPPVPVLRWRSCDGGFQCATARVPLDYRDPRGAAISIAMMRHRATDPARRIGALFFNSGGPSEQIDDFPAEYAGFPPAVRARFDILTFDPRGFGHSTAVRCFPTATAENQFLAGLPAFPAGPRQESVWERTWARFDALCARRNGPLIDHDTTADVARDMDLLRQAVGDPALNYVGLSYGSGLGATYANLFPARAGHLILDANVNPVAWTGGDGGLPTSLRLGQDQASAASMRAFLDLCGKAPAAACAFSAGTPAATRAKFAALLRRLRRHPVTIGTPPQDYTYADTVTAVPLGTVSQWQAGASLLQQLWAASAARRPSAAASPAARGQATPLAGPAAASPAAYAGQEQALAVSCADGPNPRDPRAYAAAARLAYDRSGALGPYWTWLEEPCAAWPAAAGQDRYAGPWNRRTASPILLLGNTGDPVLPYQDSVAMSRDLARARLLTIDGYGHTEAANPSTCATGYEIRYLLTGALPPAGTTCEQDAMPFPPPSP